jgi:phosphatidylinositol alpha-1,6-mannosyltransferase
MRILVVSQMFPPRTGGSGRWLWELYRRLTGATVVVAAGQADGAAAFDRTAPMAIVRVGLDFARLGALSLRGAAGYCRAFLAVRRLAAARRSDALHCGKCVPEGVLGAAVRWTGGPPYSCYIHGEELGLAATIREFRLLTRLALSSAERLIANSRHSRDLLIQEWAVPPAKIVVMHPGVDTERFVPSPPDAAARERLGWAGRRVILTVGALQKRKGQDMMIRALPAIRAACPDVLYAMVGEGWERDYLEALAAEHGVADAVRFSGIASEAALVEQLQQCDLFALPNRRVGWDFEGFGIALIEAQACGRAVIAGQSGGAPETIVPGATGELVECDTPGPLADAAIRLLNDPERRRAMGEAGRRWVVSQFSWEILAQQAATHFTAAPRQPAHA